MYKIKTIKKINRLEDIPSLKIGEVIEIGQLFEEYGSIPALCDYNDGKNITLLMRDKNSNIIIEYPKLTINGTEGNGIEGFYQYGLPIINFQKNTKKVFHPCREGYHERALKIQEAGL